MTRRLAGAGPALFRVVRFLARRGPGEDRTVRTIMVLDAVDTHGADASVASVAFQLGIDQSGASRFISAAIKDGHLRRDVSSADRRRASLVVTAAGRTLLTAARAWQDQVFAELTADWDAADARQFAGHLNRLAAGLAGRAPHLRASSRS
ncbi:MAG TPA: MarR family winged helix-turn-helix transcriptional regulator [Amycolatopsis sp.]|nr:MarR family winged helix-turn-helix transcriptional regulator [Amycolatopsis sp.]